MKWIKNRSKKGQENLIRKIMGLITIILCASLTLNAIFINISRAGAFADLVGISDDTGGYITDNGIDYGLGSLSDAANNARLEYIRQGMRDFKTSEALRKAGYDKASKFFRNRSTQNIGNYNGSSLSKGAKFLGGAMMILNIYNTSTDTYKLITEDSKHDTTTEKVIDKALGATDAAMGWYAIGLGIGAIITAPTIGAGVVAAGAVTGTTYLVSKLTIGATRIAFNSQTYRDFSAFMRGKKKLVFTPFTRGSVKEGLDIIEEELGFELYPGLKREIPDPDTGIPVYKPNIYIYNDNGEDLTLNVKLYPPNWITKSIPKYDSQKGWDAEVTNGSLNGAEDFLFYEAVVPDKGFQMKRGFVVHGATLTNDITEIMNSYSFTHKETADFVEFWTQMLDADKDYLFYPQYNKIVDSIMPLVTDVQPDNIFRLWFYIVEEQACQGADTCVITQQIETSEKNRVDIIELDSIEPIIRQGLTIVEWGGIIK